MGLTKKQIKEIRLLDLNEAFVNIKQSDADGIFYKELTAIENAIGFIENGE